MQKLSYDDCKLEYRCYDIPIHTSAFAFIGNIGKFGSGGKTAHFHNCMEIGYCYEGSGIGLIEDKEVAYKQGDICVIAPDTIHVFDAQEGMISKWEWIMADTRAALEGTKYEDLGRDKRLLRDNPVASNIFPEREYPSLIYKVKMLLQLFHGEEVRPNTIKGLLLSFLAEYAECLEEVFEDTRHQSKSNKIKSVLLYIQRHYKEKISICTLAEICELSEEQFRRIFKQVTHTAPLEYLNQYRIKAACKLLLRSKMSVSEVARETGFVTASTFNRQFTAVKGISPLKWRQIAAEKTEIVQVESLEAGQLADIFMN